MKMNPNKMVKLASSMIVVGIGLSILAIVCGAKTNIGIINGEIVLSNPFEAYEKTKQILVEEIQDGEVIEVVSDTNTSEMIHKQEALNNIKALNISVDAMDVNILLGDTYGIDVTYRKDIKVNYKMDGKTLVVEQEDHINWNQFDMGYKRGTVNIYIPKESQLDYVDIEMGMGSNEIKDVQIKELNLECGLGEAVLKNVAVDKAYIEGGLGSIRARELVSQDLEITMGMGSVDIMGDLKNRVNIEGGMGELKLITTGQESDYNYKIIKGMGTVTINDERYTSLEDIKINNGAPHNIYIEGGMGTISVKTEK